MGAMRCTLAQLAQNSLLDGLEAEHKQVAAEKEGQIRPGLGVGICPFNFHSYAIPKRQEGQPYQQGDHPGSGNKGLCRGWPHRRAPERTRMAGYCVRNWAANSSTSSRYPDSFILQRRACSRRAGHAVEREQVNWVFASHYSERKGWLLRRFKASGFCRVQSGQPGCAGKSPRDARQRPWGR